MNRFDEAEHQYYINERRVPSVTQICTLLDTEIPLNPTAFTFAAQRGTAIHELCADIDMGVEPASVPQELAGYIKAYLDFCRDYSPEWLYIEKPLYNETDGYAGTLDRFGTINGDYYIADIKTASNMARKQRIRLCAQIAGYRRAIPKAFAFANIRGIGVQLKANGQYTVHKQEVIEKRYGFDSDELFDTILQNYKLLAGG